MNPLTQYDADLQRDLRSLRARVASLERQLRIARSGLGSALITLAERNEQIADLMQHIPGARSVRKKPGL